MKYLIFLVGTSVRHFDVEGLEDLKIKAVNSEDTCIINLETTSSYEDVKTVVKNLCEELGCWYFMSEFPDKLSCNLDDEDAQLLFQLDYVPQKQQDDEDIFQFIQFINEEDEEEDDLVQSLKEKYLIKSEEPTLDEILEKIHNKGISSLSIQEKSILNSYN